jgi:predicted transcriptional regulator
MDEPQRPRRPSKRKTNAAASSWDRADTFFAMNAVKRGMAVAEIAGFLGRTENEVLEQIQLLQRGAGIGSE